MMKKFKIILAMFMSFFGVAAIVGTNVTRNTVVETNAASGTISAITGKKWPGSGDLALATDDNIGTYGASYTGNVFDDTGKAISVVLKSQGAAGSSGWTGTGSRRYDLVCSADSFKTAIGTGTSFCLTKDSVFVNGDEKITFGKEYRFAGITASSFTYTEIASAGFDIAEVETRVDNLAFRVGVNNFSNLAAGFTDKFIGNVTGKDGKTISATITDYANGNTSAGNRRVKILLAEQAKDNSFLISKDSYFYSYSTGKVMVFGTNYRITNTTLTTCDGTNHSYGEEVVVDNTFVKECTVCGYKDVRDIPVYNPVLGTTYYSSITAGTQTEVNLKVDGCTSMPTATADYRGKAMLDGNEVDVKINANGTALRFYIYVANDSSAATEGHLFINKDTKFATNPLASYLQFTNSFYLGYDNAHHITKCDGTSHSFATAVEVGGQMVETCKGCGYQKSATIYSANFTKLDGWASKDGDVGVNLKIGNFEGLTGAAAVYRGNGTLNGNANALKITVSNGLVRIYAYGSSALPAAGSISVSKDTLFKADGNVISYIRFTESFVVTFNTSTNKLRVDKSSYQFIDSTITNVTKKNWISATSGEVTMSFIGVNLSNNADTLSTDTVYRGTAKLDGADVALRVVLKKVDGQHKLAFIFNGSETGTLVVSKDTIFNSDSKGTYFALPEVLLADTVKFSEDLTFAYDSVNNLVNAKSVELSFSGTGAWSQALDSSVYNAMASFNDCSISGIYEDNSEIHPETQQHRGYHFYGKGYDKADDTTEVDVDIWISNFTDGDAGLNIATVKTAVYVNLPNNAQSAGVKLHKDSVFICSAYNMKMTLDADYLIKWYQNSSRTTAGKYNDDQVGPTIIIDTTNIQSFTEGDDVPTLPVACYDDVDDLVANVTQVWQDGAITDGKLNAGTWKVTINATDAAGNAATPVVVDIVVNAKEVPATEEEATKKGCNGSIAVTSSISLFALAGLALVSKKRKEN